jgi:hypothetical protein
MGLLTRHSANVFYLQILYVTRHIWRCVYNSVEVTKSTRCVTRQRYALVLIRRKRNGAQLRYKYATVI